MNYQTTFKRYELKYLLTPAQKALILQVMQPYMALDRYGRTAIRNIYFDTENFRLIRRSLEKPAYKEKLRIRSYRAVGPRDDVFVKLKKKPVGGVQTPGGPAAGHSGLLLPYRNLSARTLADRRGNRLFPQLLSAAVPHCVSVLRTRGLRPRWKTVISGLHLTKTSYTALITFP